MKKLIRLANLLCLLTLFSSVVSAQEGGRIRGKIVTSEGKAAEGISVQILDKKYGASTNSKGEYRISNVQPGTYTVKISAVGLMPIEKKISVAANQELSLDFTLAESYSQLEEVSVYAGKKNKFAISKSQTVAKMPLKNLENPQVYSSIPKALFQEQIITDFTTALRNSPGVYKIQGNRGINSDGATFYAVRGFRTEASLLDGVPGQTNGEIDPANIEKVEVMKGPSGTLYGGSLISFGGLINIVTKKPVDTVGGEVSYTTGSYNLNRFTADVYGPVNGNKKLLVRLNAAYQNQNSWQDAGFKKSTFIAPAVEYRVNEKLTLNLDAGFYNSEGTSPSVIFLNRTRQFVAHTPEELNFDWKRSFTSNDLTIKNPTVNFRGQINYKISDNWKSQTIFSSNNRKSDGFYQYEFIRTKNDEMLERNISYQNTTNTATDIQQNFTGDFKIAGLRNRLVFGLDYLNQTINNNISPYIVPDTLSGISSSAKYVNISRALIEAKLAASKDAPTKNYSTTNIYSAYASDVLNVTDRLMAMFSLRVDRFQSKGTMNEATNTLVANSKYMQTAVSPKFGLVYQLIKDQVSLFGNYMNGFSNVTPVTQPVQTGLSGIFKPQHANQYEGGVKMDLLQNRLSFTASYYDIKVDNVTRADQVTVDNKPYNVTYQDGTQLSKGVEFELITNPVDGLNIIAGYSHNDSKLTRSTAALEGRRPAAAGPADLLNGWASYTLLRGDLRGLGLGFGGNYVGKHLTANSAVTGVFTLPSYTLLNTTVFYDTKWYRLGVKVDNLTNELYFTGQGVLSAQMPRTVSGNITLKF